MERLEEYRQYIETLFLDRESLGSMRLGVETEAILDRERDRYQLIRVGWQNSSTRIYGCLLHVDIKDGKIWIQEDGGEEAIADKLLALEVRVGVPFAPCETIHEVCSRLNTCLRRSFLLSKTS